MLRLLAEVYQLPELKLNLKFEVEVLCKALDVALDDVRASTLLRGRHGHFTEHDFRASAATTGRGGALNKSAGADDDNDRYSDASRRRGCAHPPACSSLRMVTVNAALLAQYPALRQIVPLAIDRAVAEIVQPVVDRSVTISTITTRELASKV